MMSFSEGTRRIWSNSAQCYIACLPKKEWATLRGDREPLQNPMNIETGLKVEDHEDTRI